MDDFQIALQVAPMKFCSLRGWVLDGIENYMFFWLQLAPEGLSVYGGRICPHTRAGRYDDTAYIGGNGGVWVRLPGQA